MPYDPAALDIVLVAMFELAVRDVKTRASWTALRWLGGRQAADIATVLGGVDYDVYTAWLGGLQAEYDERVKDGAN